MAGFVRSPGGPGADRDRVRRARRRWRPPKGKLALLFVAAALLGLGCFQLFSGTGEQPVPELSVVPAPTQKPPATAFATTDPPEETATRPLRPELPDFGLIIYQDPDAILGGASRFHRLIGGQPLVVNLWASNCPPCTAEMPHFETVWRSYEGRVLFLGLDVGRFFPPFGDDAVSRRTLQELGISYPAGTPDDVSTVKALQVLALPTTFFIRSDGTVQRKWTGSLNAQKIADLTAELLKDDRPAL